MRIRPYKPAYNLSLYLIYEAAARADGTEPMSEAEFLAWFADPEQDFATHSFVITDDDDELNPWGQSETLDGLEGDVVGYTTLALTQDTEGYHLLCRGAVHPAHRREHGGRLLLIGALNRARQLAFDFEYEAEQAGIPVYFEALLPIQDPASPRLAESSEMQPVDDALAPTGFMLYRREL